MNKSQRRKKIRRSLSGDSGGSAVGSELISRAYVGYFPFMASLPFGEAEAHRNNQRHENKFYRCEVGKRSTKIYFGLVVLRHPKPLPAFALSFPKSNENLLFFAENHCNEDNFSNQ